MEKRLKVILVVVSIILFIQVAFVLIVIRSSLPTTVNSAGDGSVSTMDRQGRLDLLETLWQSEDFKDSTPDLRRKAFESIVVE